MEKKAIRKEIFARRKELTLEEIQKDSHLITEKIVSMEAYQEANSIYLYMDCKGEAATGELFRKALQDGKQVAAPKVYGEEMKYHLISSMEEIEPGYFGVPEPKESCALAEDEKALLIVPGVAFDKNLHRCGYGKGFYDRYLSVHTKHPTVAIAFDFQVVEEVPADVFDICPMKLVTPTRIFEETEKKEDVL
jgi:5-formyltetrahydrofolate cyclo-ligase